MRILLSSAILLLVLGPAGIAHTEDDTRPLEIFKCKSGVYWQESAPEVLRLTVTGEITGTVKVAGVTHKTQYRVAGVNRRWDWPLGDNDIFDYTIVLKPDGTALFVDFEGVEENTSRQASDFFKCKSVSIDSPMKEYYPQHTPKRSMDEPSLSNRTSPSTQNSPSSGNEMAAYQFALRQRVMRNWAPPSSAIPGLDCLVQVRQSATGEVISARVVSCNGDAAVERSIEAAVYNASPLPLPADRALFDPNLRFRFVPED